MTKYDDKKWDDRGLSSLLKEHAPLPQTTGTDLEESIMRAVSRQPTGRGSLVEGLISWLKLPPLDMRFTGSALMAGALIATLIFGVWYKKMHDDEQSRGTQLAQIEQANEVLALSLDYDRAEDDSYLKRGVENIFGRY